MPESPRLAYPPPANIFGKYHSWKADVDLRQTHTLDCSCKRPHAVTVTVTPAPALHMQVPDYIWTTWNCFHFLLPVWLHRATTQGRAAYMLFGKQTNKHTMSSVKAGDSSALLKGEWQESLLFLKAPRQHWWFSQLPPQQPVNREYQFYAVTK